MLGLSDQSQPFAILIIQHVSADVVKTRAPCQGALPLALRRVFHGRAFAFCSKSDD